MKKFKYLTLSLIICTFLFSCTLDGFMTGMGKNILGNKKPDISSVKESAGKGGNPEDMKEDNPAVGDLEEIIKGLPGNPGETGLPEHMLEPLDPETADELANAAQTPGDKELDKLKNEEKDWTEDDQANIQGAIEVISKLFNIWDWDGKNVKPAETYDNQTEVGDVFYTLQDNLGKIYVSPDTATVGDVVALQYSLTVLVDVSNEIKALEIKTSEGETINNLGDLMTAIDKKQVDMQDVLNSASDSDSVNKLLGEVTTYVDVVGKCSNLTGGKDLSAFIKGFLGGLSSSDNGNSGENSGENTGDNSGENNSNGTEPTIGE